MRLFTAILIISLLIPTMAVAGGWNKVDTILFASSTALTFVDYKQTIQITRNPDKYWEMNPALGRHPSESRVRNHFIIGAVGGWFVADYLKGWKRTAFLATWFLLEAWCVNNNIEAGIEVKIDLFNIKI